MLRHGVVGFDLRFVYRTAGRDWGQSSWTLWTKASIPSISAVSVSLGDSRLVGLFLTKPSYLLSLTLLGIPPQVPSFAWEEDDGYAEGLKTRDL